MTKLDLLPDRHAVDAATRPRPDHGASPMKTPSVSVVVPALDEEETIGQLLDTLLRQTIRPMEILVVDAGSTDGTLGEVEARRSRDRRVRVLHSPGALPGKARNVGARASKGECLLFIDCGLHIATDCIEGLYRRARQTRADVVFARIVPDCGTFFQECAAIAYLAPWQENRERPLAPTVQVLWIRRSLFFEVGPFREDLRSAEDLLFLRALHACGASLAYAPEVVAQWQLAPTLSSTFRRFRTYSEHTLRAGLWATWHARLCAYYALATFVSVPAVRAWGISFCGLVFGGFFALRSLRSLARHRRAARRRDFRSILSRALLVGLILLVVDAATFFGTWDYLFGWRGGWNGRRDGTRPYRRGQEA